MAWLRSVCSSGLGHNRSYSCYTSERFLFCFPLPLSETYVISAHYNSACSPSVASILSLRIAPLRRVSSVGRYPASVQSSLPRRCSHLPVCGFWEDLFLISSHPNT